MERLVQNELPLAATASRAEQFSLWAMRLWWQGFPEIDAVWGDLVRGFRVCGVSTALEPWHRFCSLMLATGGAGHAIACIYYPRVMPGETLLLDALATAARGSVELLEAHLRAVTPPTVARLAAPHACRFATALTEARLDWPTSNYPQRHSQYAAVASVPTLASNRLH
jgi:hypothetical protein